MYISNITNDYDIITSSNNTDILNENDNMTFTNSTNIENEVKNFIFKILLLSIPSSILLFSLISLSIYTLIKPLLNNKSWRNFYNHLTMLQLLLQDHQYVENQYF